MSTDIAKYERLIASLESKQRFIEKAMKLQNNRDFREVILEGFCKEYAASFLETAGSIVRHDQRARDEALQMALASGHLARWFTLLEKELEDIPKAIADAKENIALLLQNN